MSFIDYLSEQADKNIFEFFYEIDEMLSEDELDIVFLEIFEGMDDDLLGLVENIEINEKISIVGRMKKARNMKKIQRKLQKAKEIKKSKNIVSKEDIDKKARKAAVDILRAKWSKGKTDRKTKEQIEDRLSRSKELIAKLAKKQRKNVLAKEKERRQMAKAEDNKNEI